jgi:predicted DNA-binding transcriptional regulator AlpA
MRPPIRYLGITDAAERVGISPNSLKRYKLPPPDALIGGRIRGWLPETIDEWNAARPGPGARTDLHPPPPRTRRQSKEIR